MLGGRRVKELFSKRRGSEKEKARYKTPHITLIDNQRLARQGGGGSKRTGRKIRLGVLESALIFPPDLLPLSS